MSTRIAVAIDFSLDSEKALTEAILLGRKLGAEVRMIHVTGEYDSPGQQSESDLDYRRQAHERFAELHQRYAGQGVELSQVIVDGKPAEQIERVAEDTSCEVIAVAPHGRSGFARFLLGSVAEKVVRRTKRDVLVSRGGAPGRGYRRLLVPTDFSPSADRALERALAIAEQGAEIDLVHAWRLPGPPRYPQATYSDLSPELQARATELQADLEARAAALVARYRRDGAHIEFGAVHGSPAKTIVEAAAGYDIVVMGAHSGGLSRLSLGTVTEKTIRHAPCSVLAVRATEGPG